MTGTYGYQVSEKNLFTSVGTGYSDASPLVAHGEGKGGEAVQYSTCPAHFTHLGEILVCTCVHLYKYNDNKRWRKKYAALAWT